MFFVFSDTTTTRFSFCLNQNNYVDSVLVKTCLFKSALQIKVSNTFFAEYTAIVPGLY